MSKFSTAHVASLMRLVGANPVVMAKKFDIASNTDVQA